MKKISLLLIGIAFFCSCKKNYTCTCETTYVYLTNSNTYKTQVMPGNNSAYSEKMTKKQAEAACAHEQNATQTNLTNAMTSEGHFPFKSGESLNTSCKLN